MRYNFERHQIPRDAIFFRVQNLKKCLHLEGFDVSRCMIDPELRWIYIGSLYIYIYGCEFLSRKMVPFVDKMMRGMAPHRGEGKRL
jgi:hypothetical protein